MAQNIWQVMLSITLLVTTCITVTPEVWAQEQTGGTSYKYTVTELPTLGGTVGSADSINNKGWVAGYANLPGDRVEHGVLWQTNGGITVTDLGTLGGPNSSVGFPAKNNQGLLVGFSQTAYDDPLREEWNYRCTTNNHLCEGKNLITLGFLWQDGVMTSLSTLGGNISEAFGVNNLGQVVGIAETGTTDTSCTRPQTLDYEAVIWGANGDLEARLAPFPGDSISAAVAINDKGQVVGGSGPCAPLSPAIGAHALLWQNGLEIDLGNLGGMRNNVAFAINGVGQVVGSSGVKSDMTAHAFLWENGAMHDLGTVPGDFFSVASSINDGGQVVGQSCDQGGNCRAFLWQNGVMTDLNALIPPGSAFHLLIANDINDQGEIVGQLFDQNTGNTQAFLATPK